MIYIFKSPVNPVLDELGQPVLDSLGRQKMTVKNHAGICQSMVEAAIGLTEHDKSIQYRKEGVYQLTIENTLNPLIDRRMVALDTANPGMGFLTSDDYIERVVDETLLPSGSIRFSPSLPGLSLADFPDNAAFGNGVSCGISFLWGGDLIQLSIVVLSDVASSLVEASEITYEVLRQIMET